MNTDEQIDYIKDFLNRVIEVSYPTTPRVEYAFVSLQRLNNDVYNNWYDRVFSNRISEDADSLALYYNTKYFMVISYHVHNVLNIENILTKIGVVLDSYNSVYDIEDTYNDILRLSDYTVDELRLYFKLM